MNSVLDYIRQLNQQSVTLPSEWLDRLRHVECDSAERAITPEIVMTRKSEIRSGGPTTAEPPLTIINQQPVAAPGSGRPSEPDAESTAPMPVPGETVAEPVAAFMDPIDAWQDFDGMLQNVIDDTPRPNESASVPGDVSSIDTTCVTPPHSGPADPSTTTDVSHRRDPPDLQPLDPFAGIPSSAAIVDSLKKANPVAEQAIVADNSLQPLERLALETGVRLSDKSLPEDAPTRKRATTPGSGISDQSQVKRFDYRRCSRPRSIDRIVDRILDRFPSVASATVLLVAAQPSIDVDGIAGRISTCLATRDVGGILLVDGNTGSRQLSSLMGAAEEPGLTDLINRSESLSATVCPTDNANLEFLPCGTGDITHRKLDAANCSKLNCELNRSFQYTIISAGSTSDTLVRYWSEYADAVYLLIDSDNADRERMTEIVNELHSRAVRVAGCIAVQS